MQAAAAPDTVLLTASTHRLVSGLFVVEECGAQELKGVANSIELYRVLRPTGVRGRLAAARGLTPFVGREAELQLLLSRWERAREGEGQLVLVSGEGGIGKSRLVAEFHDRIRDTPHIWMESAGNQFFQNTPFYAITEMLSQWLELQALGGAQRSRVHEAERSIAEQTSLRGAHLKNDSATCALEKERLECLERALASAGLKPEDTAPLIADLLQLPVGERYPAITLNPEQRRRRLLAALTRWVFGAARLQPLVMVVEDFHWLDPSTLELEQMLAEQGVMVPLMLLCTARPEFHAPWPLRSHHTQITLSRLSARNVREMVALVAARTALARESVETVIERTGGVPLFVEELTRALLEGGQSKLSRREIPVTLHDSLMARLDRLGPAKEVIQIGAVIGGEFSHELLRAVHPMAETELQAALRKLTDAELLYVRGIAPDAIYQFKHALIRDAAYEALLKSRRRELHREVAVTIDGKFPMLKEAHPEMLARHWSEAGEPDHAITEWQRAGKAAEARNAFIEARESYQQAIALLDLLPESPERDLRELELAQSIVRPLVATAGYTAPETIRAIEHAAVLAEKSGSLKQLVDLMISRGVANHVAGNLQAAAALADRALELALREGSPVSLGRAHAGQMRTRFFVGDLAGVEEHFLAGLKFFEGPDIIRQPVGTISAFAVASWSAWTLGRADVARDREARLMAVGVTNLFVTILKAYYAAHLRAFLREYDRVEAWAVQVLELSGQRQSVWTAALARAALGDARWRLGRVAEGIASLRRGIAEMLEVEARSRSAFIQRAWLRHWSGRALSLTRWKRSNRCCS